MKKFCKILAVFLTFHCQSWAAGFAHVQGNWSASNVSFPSPSAAWLGDGIFPNLENLAKMRQGLTKKELLVHFGTPHFSEGFFGVTQWDYIFKFNSPSGVAVCQYQIRFNSDYRVDSSFWNRPECANLATPPRAERIVERIIQPAAPALQQKTIRFNTDQLFAYDKYSANDILGTGKTQLALLAQTILALGNIQSIDIVGHTDRLGAHNYNMDLSNKRAQTVQSILAQSGIPMQIMQARGVGETQPIKNCAGQHATAALIGCLQDNRRVDLNIVFTSYQPNANAGSPIAIR